MLCRKNNQQVSAKIVAGLRHKSPHRVRLGSEKKKITGRDN
jgi:hypothetical protein